ncbi:MAG TPA: class I SAM-dependent methyltransferase [Candidatus Limnocylindrales bacterium]|nr:class I SAM-dependent methyltransferase [Candidatus Limnocylindrales bacterium]
MTELPPDPDGHFGERVAATYDDDPEPMIDGTPVDDATAVLQELARGGRALELAIGTGRIGLPLAARGVGVAGIELSSAMLAKLRAKPGGEAIEAAVGDMTSARIAGPFSLVYLVFNTIENVTTQAGQVAVFRNAAAHLAPGGRFLIECNIPGLRRLPEGETAVVFDANERHFGVDTYDVAIQSLTSHHFTKRDDGTWEYGAGPFRYVWPAELDLMAELAGLRLRERWSGWDRRPFSHDSRHHVSIWEKPA